MLSSLFFYQILYYVAVNGHSSGPFDLQTIKNMYDKGMFKLNDLVWKQGMSDWAVAESIEEIKDLIKK